MPAEADEQVAPPAAQLYLSTGRSRRRSELALAVSPSPCRFQARFEVQPDRPSP